MKEPKIKFLIAPSAFKGSLSPLAVAKAVEQGLQTFADKQRIIISSKIIPLADGGDGTLESIKYVVGGTYFYVDCPDAFGDIHSAPWLLVQDNAIIELASVCGIGNGTRLSPLESHTRGLGVMIRHVLEKHHPRKIIIALGGSASTDGGSGALYELGARFFDKEGKPIIPKGGSTLSQIVDCDLESLQKLCSQTQIELATDVESPLLGTSGAAHVFAPQKGATAEEILLLDLALTNFANTLERASVFKAQNIPGSGAAGGTAFGLACAAKARIISGFSWLYDLFELKASIKTSDVIISGEGKFDSSSLVGKASGRLLQECLSAKKRFWLVAGSIDPGLDSTAIGIDQFILPGKNKFADSESISAGIYQVATETFGNI
ncbi:MAG: glycerate kinase [Candidatus Obscuribacterales bacterium]|nr:glycerate kinase [Candidatus Obscuribacterales bacterium]